MISRLRRLPYGVVAAGCCVGLALLAVAPALIGRAAVTPEIALDKDPLYRTGDPPAAWLPIDRTPIAIDIPRDVFIARGLQQGKVHIWNPFTACGAPLWAEQGGPFFPLKLPFYLSPSIVTYTLFLALRLAAAGFGAYLLARVRGLPFVPALMAGVAFELSGPMLDQLPFGNSSATCVLPWVLLGSAHIGLRPSALATVATAVALGVAGHGGHPTLIVLVYVAFGAATIGHLVSNWRQPRRAAIIAISSGLAFVLGLALAAPVLLPLAELTQFGNVYKFRAVGYSWTELMLEISRAVLPMALFTPDSLAIAAREFAPALGGSLLLLAFVGILARGLDALLVAVALAGILLSFAPPPFGWLATLPGVDAITPTYAWSLIILPLTQAAGSGVQIASQSGRRRTLFLALLLVLLGAVWVWPAAEPYTWLHQKRHALRQMLEQPWGAARFAVGPAAAVGLAALALWLRRSSRRLAIAVLAACAIAEQLSRALPLATRYPPSTVIDAPPSRAVEFLQGVARGGDGRISATPYWIGQPMTTTMFDIPDVRTFASIPTARYWDYLLSANPNTDQLTVQTTPSLRAPLLGRAAMRYIVVPRRGARPPALFEQDPNFALAFTAGAVAVYENRGALPRARIVHEFTFAPDRDAARQLLRTLHTDKPANDGSVPVILEPDEHGVAPAPLQGRAESDEWVRISDAADPDRIVLEAHLSSPGMLVLADTYYPGWRAWVDGQRAAIHPADVLFRAVPLASGTHTIVFEYAPLSFRLGLAAAALAAIVCGAMLWSQRRLTRSAAA